MTEPRFPEPDVRQVIIPVGMFDVIEVIFAEAGFALGKVPHIDMPTYLPFEAPPETLAKIATAARQRIVETARQRAIREGNTRDNQETQ